MDNLRVAVIVGVIVTHVATAYVLDSDWHYEERTSHAAARCSCSPWHLPVGGACAHGDDVRVRGLGR
jgi:hypothetical protein